MNPLQYTLKVTRSNRFLIYYFLGLVAAVILFTVAAAVIDRQVEKRHERLFNEQQSLQTSLAKIAMEDHLTSLFNSIRFLGAHISQERNDPIIAKQHFTEMFKNIETNFEDVLSLFYLDSSGRIILSQAVETRDGREAERLSHIWSTNYWPELSRATKFPLIPPVHVSEIYQMFGLLYPVVLDGRIDGAIGAIIDLKPAIGRYVAPMRSGRFGAAYFLDDRGLIIYNHELDTIGCNALEKIDEGLPDQTRVFRRFLDEPNGMDACLVADQGRKAFSRNLIAWQTVKIGDRKLILVLSAPDSEIDPILSEFRTQRLLLGGLLALVILMLSLVFFRKSSAEALSRIEERFRLLAEKTNDLICLHDNRWNLLYISPSSQRLLGFLPEEMIGQPPSVVVHPEDVKSILREAKAFAEKGEFIQRYECRLRNKAGEYIWFASQTEAIQDRKGRVLRIVSTSRDITEKRRAEEALRESERKYRTILEAIGEGYYEVDLNGTFTFFNPSFCEILGYSPEELIGMNYRECVSAQDAQMVYLDFRRVYQTGQDAAGLEWNIPRKDGQERFLEVSIALRQTPSGEIIGFRGLVRDVTPRKKAIEALKESEKKYRALYDNALVAMYRNTVEDGQAIEANDVFVRMFGYASREEVLADFKSINHYAEPQGRRTFLEALLHHHRLDSFTIHFKRKDGRTFWGEISCQLHEEKGYIDGVIIDITERKLAQDALRESEERFQELFNNISDLIVTHDLDGRILDMNPAVLSAFNDQRPELLGHLISEFMLPKYKPLFKDYLDQLITSGQQKGVFIIVAKDGVEHYLEFSANLVQQEDCPPYVTSVSRDVTERILSQRELRRMEEQLVQSQKMQAVGTLASGISHDFNNILQAISGYIQLLLAREVDPETNARYLAEVDRAVVRAMDLVRSLLTFSRRVEPELKPIDLNVEVEETVRLLERTIPKMIEIETDLAPNLRKILGDPGQIEQVLMNLGANAKDAMPDGGRLIFKTDSIFLTEQFCRTHLELKPGEYIRLLVADTGIGMNVETLAHAFEPFFTTKELGKGTGLGLSTVYGVVKAHGGHIICESQPGAGTAFQIFIPIPLDDQIGEEEDQEVASQIQSGRETILVVDDETSILEIAKDTLTPLGYRVLIASSGEEALLTYESRTSTIDLVILDLGMPGIGGEACLKKLIEIDPHVKVIIASGYSLDSGAQTLLDSGAKGFVAKPYRLAGMLQQVRQVLDA